MPVNGFKNYPLSAIQKEGGFPKAEVVTFSSDAEYASAEQFTRAIAVGAIILIDFDVNWRILVATKASGVKVELDIWEDMIHVWPIFAPILPEGQQAIEQIGEFVRQQIK